MPDTQRTLAALQALLADNVAQNVSPQDVRDFLVSVYPVVEYVKNNGAKVDGATDDIAAIQATVDKVEAAGRGGVGLGDAISIVSAPVILPSGVVLIGGGSQVSILKLQNGANDNVVETKNFGTLTGTNKLKIADGVPHGFGLRGVGIDGNRANNTSGDGIKIYGKRYILDNVMVYECAGNGIYSEGGDVGAQDEPGTQADLPESFIGPVWCRRNGGHGIQYRGPHDGVISSAVCALNNLDGISLEFNSGVYNGACDIRFLHSYANLQKGLRAGVVFRADFLQLESNDQEGLIITAVPGNCQIGQLLVFKNSENNVGVSYEIELQGTFNTIGNLRAQCDFSAGGVNYTGIGNRIENARIEGQERAAIGVRLAANDSYFNGLVHDFTAAGGIGIQSGAVAGIRLNDIRAMSFNNDICWNNVNDGKRNFYKALLSANATQTPFSGVGPASDNSEFWDFIALDTDSGDMLRSSNKGSATVLNTTTFIDVTHNLIATPAAEDIQITPSEDPVKRYWVDTVGASTFRINVDSDPGADITFLWQARI